MTPPTPRYYPLSRYLKERFGGRVRKVTIECGFTCPNRDSTKGAGGCVYCEPLTLVPKDLREGLTVTEQIDCGIERLKKRYDPEKFIAYFQINTNTYDNLGRLEKLYKEAMAHPLVCAIAVSTRPDCVDSRVLELLRGLKKEKHLWLEMGLQSANDRTLERINRGHTATDFKDAVLRSWEKGMDVCAHAIFGLPGEGREEMLDTVRFISELPVWGIKFHQLDVVKGTALEEMYGRGGFKILSLEEYAQIVVESLELLPPGVTIHRLSGTTPSRLLIEPRWGLDKFLVKAGIERLLEEKDTRQGAKRRGINFNVERRDFRWLNRE
ncbi:MAG: TIGR01212 family radical SAM protein [Deltaproteobacteria bacterium]|nr:TIGR01212 family radical SAM protein [Deltaproteobacteria bacterium]